MKTCIRGLVACLLAAAVCGAEDWTALFDGKTLDGWHRAGFVNGTAEYTVENGCIVGTTKPKTANSFLCTDKPYANFILELEYKVPAGMNSGIQIRSICDPDVKGGRVHGYQVEIDPSGRAWSAGIYDEARRGWLYNVTHIEKERGKAAAQAAKNAFKPDEWNHLRVEAIGPHIRTWLNDVQVADLKDDLTLEGIIALQVHATKDPNPKQIRWRNLRIQDLGLVSGSTRDHLGTLEDTLGQPPPNGARVLLGPDGDLSAWSTHDGEAPAWPVKNGVLTVKPGAGSIVTRQDVRDFKLHLEFRVNDSGKGNIQANGNSGVYIQKRYEIQITNSHGRPADSAECGAIYRFKAPDQNVCRPAGEWQSYDIVFRSPRWDDKGRKTTDARISVVHNGVLIHDNVAIPAKTGAGRPEGPEPGPIELQDHGNPVSFRNIWVRDLQTIAVAVSELDRAWEDMLSWQYGQSRTALILIENTLRDADEGAKKRLETRLIDSLDLEGATVDARRFMCRMLGRFGSEDAVPALAPLLATPDLATDARKALADMSYDSVDTAFKNALGLDLPASVTAGILVSIGERGRPPSVDDVAAFVEDQDAAVRRAAVEALGAIGTPEAEKHLRALFSQTPEDPTLGRALLACAEEAGEKEEHSRAANLCRLLLVGNATQRIQAGALRILGETSGDDAIPQILNVLGADDALVRDVAVHLVRDMPGTAIVDRVSTVLPELGPAVQVAVLNAFAARGDNAASPAALTALNSERDDVRSAAADLLGRIGDSRHVAVLADVAAQGGEPGKAAAKALSMLTGGGVEDRLIELLGGDSESRTKAAVLDALVARAAHDAVPAVLKLTEATSDGDAQRDFWRGLRDLARPADLPTVLDTFFKMTDKRVRREAEKAIAAIARRVADDDTRASILLAGLDRAPDPTRPLMVSLLSLAPGPRTEKALIERLDSPDKQCRYEAVKALGTWEGPGPYEALKTYAGKTDELTHNVLAIRGCVRLLDLDGTMPEETRLKELDALAKLTHRPEERELLQAARTSLRVTDLKARNGKPYEFIRRGFEVGNKAYIDREYTFTEIPDVMATADHIKTAMDDKYSKGDDWLSFSVNRAATVIVAYDGRARRRPDWLKDWRKLDIALRSTDRGCDLQLFAKRFPAGKVVVPGNNPVPGVGAMYTVGVSNMPVE